MVWCVVVCCAGVSFWCAGAASAVDVAPTWKRQNALDSVDEEEIVLGADGDRRRAVNRFGNSVRFGSTGMAKPDVGADGHVNGANGYH